MPHCFVKQPNGKYAIWSTIVDSFVALDCTKEEAIEEELQKGTTTRKWLEPEFRHIEQSGIAWDWANDWNDCIRWLETTRQTEMLEEIDSLGLPRRMKRTVSSLKQEEYWRFYWRNKCEDLEAKIRVLEARLQSYGEKQPR